MARIAPTAFTTALLLVAGIAIGAPQTGGGAPPPVTVLGSAQPAAQPEKSDNGGVTILRGSRPVPTPAPLAPPAAADACPEGYVDMGPAGCVPPGYAEEPIYDLYWPFFVRDGRRRHVHHPVPRFAHRGAFFGAPPPSAMPHR